MADIFALRDSGLNAFLFSEVGMEPNGTSLTILSLLARLGKDPWVEAAAWARKPKAAAARLLSDSISQMPPNQQASANAHLTALRLVDLLPARDLAGGASNSLTGSPITMSQERLLVVALIVVFLAFTLWQALGPKPATNGTRTDAPVTALAK
jgi:hypothetical protein